MHMFQVTDVLYVEEYIIISYNNFISLKNPTWTLLVMNVPSTQGNANTIIMFT